eukprot:38091-Pleurochrysis_carterae.AAC.1
MHACVPTQEASILSNVDSWLNTAADVLNECVRGNSEQHCQKVSRSLSFEVSTVLCACRPSYELFTRILEFTYPARTATGWLAAERADAAAAASQQEAWYTIPTRLPSTSG